MPIELEVGEILRDGMAEDVTYNPSGGTPVEVDAIIDRHDYLQDRTNNGMYLRKSADLYISAEDISTPEPDGDTVTFDSLEWGVTGFTNFDETVYKISVIRGELINKKARR